MSDPREIYKRTVRRQQRRDMIFWAGISVLLCICLGGLLWLMI